MAANKNKFLKKFGKNLKRIRLSQNLTQEELANEIDVEISQISRIERGLINTSIYNTKVIAEALDVHLTELFDID